MPSALSSSYNPLVRARVRVRVTRTPRRAHQPTHGGAKGEEDRQASRHAAVLDGADERREQVAQRERQHEADEDVLQVEDRGRLECRQGVGRRWWQSGGGRGKR